MTECMKCAHDPPCQLQVPAPKHRRISAAQTGGCQNCSTQAKQLPLPHLASWKQIQLNILAEILPTQRYSA